MPKLVRGLEPPFEPLLSRRAIDRFETLIDRDSVVFEYGSGASTLWLATRTFLTVSIEHNEEWYDEVTTRHEALNATVYLVTNPTAYAMMADEFPDRMFDLVFVDGWDITRSRCIKLAIPKLKPGGWMVVDDAQWPILDTGVEQLEGWEREDYTGLRRGRSDGQVKGGMTSFFRKPR
jgi:predicted O-methyltransferase YrrM